MKTNNTEREELIKLINDKVYHLELPEVLAGLDMETGQYIAADKVVDFMLNWHNSKMEERDRGWKQMVKELNDNLDHEEAMKSRTDLWTEFDKKLGVLEIRHRIITGMRAIINRSKGQEDEK